MAVLEIEGPSLRVHPVDPRGRSRLARSTAAPALPYAVDEICSGRSSSDGTRLVVAGETVDLANFHILPGLINAHDHLHLNAFPASPCRAPYPHAADWVEDMADLILTDAYRGIRAISDRQRAWHGALKNALAGTTTVVHHDPWLPVFDDPDFPVTVVGDIGWAHSLGLAGRYGPLPTQSFAATPPGRPWFIHLAEGTDERAAAELAALAAQGCLDGRTRLVHGVGLGDADLGQVAAAGASLVLCPSANQTLLGEPATDVFARRLRRLPAGGMPWMTDGGSAGDDQRVAPGPQTRGVRLSLGTDSRLTGSRDLLDELRWAARVLAARGVAVAPSELLRLVNAEGAEVAGRPKAGRIADGAPADLVVVRRRGGPAASLLAGRRSALEMVWSSGRLLMSSPGFASLFAATEEPAVKAALDGRPVWLAQSMVEPALGGGLAEPGLTLLPPRMRSVHLLHRPPSGHSTRHPFRVARTPCD